MHHRRTFTDHLIFFVRVLLILFVLVQAPLSYGKTATAVEHGSAPLILSPRNNDIIYATANTPGAMPVFRWQPVNGARRYHYEISRGASYLDDDRVWQGITAQTVFTPTDILLSNNEVYCWRVRVQEDQNGKIGPYSEPACFQRDWTKTGPAADNRPELLLPNNRDEIAFLDPVNPSTPPAFSWTPVIGAGSYRLELSEQPGFDTVFAVYTTQQTTYQFDDILKDGVYYWRIVPVQKSKTQEQPGKVSEPRQFTAVYHLTHFPQRSSPLDNAVLHFTPAFRWKAVRGAQSYVLQYAAGEALSPDTAITVQTDNLSYTLLQPLDQGKMYTWRVGAVSGKDQQVAWSPVYHFQINWNPSTRLLIPPQGFPYVNDPFFRWTPVEGAVRYVLALSDQPSMVPLLWENNTVQHAQYAFHDFSLCSEYPTQDLYWQVTPVNDTGTLGTASEVFHFRCDPVASAPALVYPPYYFDGISSLEKSYAGEAIVPLPVFQWKWVYDPAQESQIYKKYRFMLGEDPLFQTITKEKDVESSQLVLDSSLVAPGKTYYWKVRPLNTSGQEVGQWSQVWAARFDLAKLPLAGAVIQPVQPADGVDLAGNEPLDRMAQAAGCICVPTSGEYGFYARLLCQQPKPGGKYNSEGSGFPLSSASRKRNILLALARSKQRRPTIG
jgi:hypothetical protein